MHTHFEDLSNEIFFEIFDYFDALEIFTSFTLLNQRISSILKLIPFRIIIPYHHCRIQIEYLSFHLIFRAHQVISLNIYDTIYDDSSIINLLFNRHEFINLQSCIFNLIDSSTKLKNVIKKIQNLKKLSSFHIYTWTTTIFNENDRNDLIRIILTRIPSLRSVVLQYDHNYSCLFNYISIPSNLTSLKLVIFVPSSIVSLHSVLPIFRHCHTIRYLSLVLQENTDNSINSSIQSQYNNDPPILQRIISFDLIIFARCDSHSISDILRSMPNLIRFNFILVIRNKQWIFPGELFYGNVWQNIFERYVPCLSQFEFHMTIVKRYPRLDLDIVINSFDYFVKKYFNWHIVIDRWRYHSKMREEYIVLRTSNFYKHKLKIEIALRPIFSQSFKTRSTLLTNDHHLFYPDLEYLIICITTRISNFNWTSPLFQQIKYLVIETTVSSSMWYNLLDLIDLHQTNADANQYVTYLSQFVYLPNVIQIEFGLSFNKSHWKKIQFILQACSNVNGLIIDTRLLFSSKLINNLSLVGLFNDIKTIELRGKNIYLPSNFASKLVERFPSLTSIELQVFSFDHCVFIIDILLIHLKNLSYIKINYSQDTLLDDPFSRDYIIEKRRQTFPNYIFDEQKIIVKNNGATIEIWLQ